MPGEIATIPRLRFYSATGAPLSGGKLTVYLTGTTTKTPTWQDQALTILNTNPIVLDGNGSCVVWVSSALTYKIVLADKNGVVQWTQSDIVGGGVDTSVEITAALLQAALDQAEAAADAAELLYNNFRNIYYGPRNSNPGLRPDGTAMQAGDLYYNTGQKFLKVYDGVTWDRPPFEGSVTTEIVVDLLSIDNVSLPNPALISGNFVVDGENVADLYRVFLAGQTNKVQNGCYEYRTSGNTLTRSTDMPSGVYIAQPFLVDIGLGDDFADSIYELASPTSALIGTDETTWEDSSENSESVPTGTALMGPNSPAKLAAIPTQRRIEGGDMPTYKTIVSLNSFPHSIFEHLNPFGYVSRYYSASSPLNHVGALQQCAEENNIIVFDRPMILASEPDVAWSGKTLIFLGEASKITITSLTTSFLNLIGIRNFETVGTMVLEWVAVTGSTVKAIKGNTLTNVRIDKVVTRNIRRAVDFQAGTMNGLYINSIQVGNLSTDTPFTIDAACAASSGKTYLRKIENQTTVETITINSSYSYNAWDRCDVLICGGAMTANRTITMNLGNATEGKTVVIRHQATGGFTMNINDSNAVLLKAITNGQSAEMYLSGGLWYLKT